jgi:hypothetical protein
MATSIQIFKRVGVRTEPQGGFFFLSTHDDPTGEAQAHDYGERWREQDPRHNTYWVHPIR